MRVVAYYNGSALNFVVESTFVDFIIKFIWLLNIQLKIVVDRTFIAIFVV